MHPMSIDIKQIKKEKAKPFELKFDSNGNTFSKKLTEKKKEVFYHVWRVLIIFCSSRHCAERSMSDKATFSAKLIRNPESGIFHET